MWICISVWFAFVTRELVEINIYQSNAFNVVFTKEFIFSIQVHFLEDFPTLSGFPTFFFKVCSNRTFFPGYYPSSTWCVFLIISLMAVLDAWWPIHILIAQLAPWSHTYKVVGWERGATWGCEQVKKKPEFLTNPCLNFVEGIHIAL